jgi:hypothetical protein
MDARGQAKGRHESHVHLHVETRMPAMLGSIGFLGLLPLFLRRHVEEETIKFAADIATKLGAGSRA